MAQIRIHRDGAVETYCGTQDIGGGARTVVLVRTSMELGYLALDRITVHIGRSEYGPSGASAGSSTTGGVTREVRRAADKVLPELFALVAPKLNCDADDLEIKTGGVIGKKGQDGGMSWTDACNEINDVLVADGGTMLLKGSQWYVCRDDQILQASEEDYKA